jgi:hypothetical protein
MQIERHDAGFTTPKYDLIALEVHGMRISILILSVVAIVNPAFAQQQTIAALPEVRGPFTLTAMYDPAAGHNAISYDGKAVPPLIRVAPGA